MTARRALAPTRVAGFRTKLLVAIMLVVSPITALGLYFAERDLAAGVEQELQRSFEGKLEARHNAEAVRHAALTERCRALVRKPRIQGALEEFQEALYDVADDELRDIMEEPVAPRPGDEASVLSARFYRFLTAQGEIITPPSGRRSTVGLLTGEEEARLALPAAPDQPQVGFLSYQSADRSESVAEVIATPIVSGQTGEVIAALVLGFKPFEFATDQTAAGIATGLWFEGRLHFAGANADGLTADVARAVVAPDRAGSPRRIPLNGEPHLLFCKLLNPGSRFPPAYEVCVYPLAGLRRQQRRLRWRVLGLGAGLLLGGLVASQFLARRLSVPVEKLAVDSERAARFSADASHQLKTPVTVLRAGLEEWLAREKITPGEAQEISALIHQTYRLSSLIEDLLLLSRMDAGALKLELTRVNLTELIEAALDDFGARPDDFGIKVETEFPTALHIAGEKRYTAIILQNLLENARKYNRPHGCVRLAAGGDGVAVWLRIGNTGRTIAPAAQTYIFERFHRGTAGENVPGYGLGLNLARELARLHQGDLRLLRSENDWTEFEVRFRLAPPSSTLTPV